MRTKRQAAMRRRNGFTPAAEPLEARRMLTAVPMPVRGFDTYFLENGEGGAQWSIQNRSGTSNGLPTGGFRDGFAGGLGVTDAFYDAAHNHAFDMGHSIWVDNVVFRPPGGSKDPGGQADVDGFTDAQGGQHRSRLSAGPSPMSGLGVSVEYYAARHSPTLRTLARFDNAGEAEVSATVTFLYNLASDSNTKTANTSSGDTSFTAGDRWIVTDDAPPVPANNVPAVTAVLRGPGSLAQPPASVSNVVYNAVGTEGVLANYAVTVPAHQTRYLMFFTQLSATSADAVVAAGAFDTAPTVPRTPFWSDLLSGVDTDQFGRILNWASNAPPVATADAYFTDEDTALHVEVDGPGVLGNDSDPDGDAITAVLETGPSHGTLDLHADGSFTYQPDPDFFGTGDLADHFSYRARDGFAAVSELTTVTIGVNSVNDVPAADAGADAAADEGSDVSFSGSGSDVETAALTYQWDFGDGSTADGPTTSHAYADDGEYAAVLTVTDADNASTTDVRTVTVANVAPTATIAGAPGGAVAEGDPVALASLVFDPGTADTHTYQWTVTRGGAVLGSGADPAYGFTPADEGEYVFMLSVTDDDGGVGTDALTVVVANAAPALDGLSFSPATVDENGTTHLAGNVADAGIGDALSISVDWADGSPLEIVPLGAGAASFDLAHVYRDDDPAGTPADAYAVSVTLTDGDGGAATASASVTVANVAPVVGPVAGPAGGAPGQVLGYAASFTDAGTLDTHDAVVDWGDGTPATSAAVTEPAGKGPGSASAAHAYAVPGVYTVTVTVTDDDGGAGRSTAVVRVAAVDVKPAELRPDPIYPFKTALYVLGTAGNDTVQITPSSQSGAVEVVLNGVNLGAFAPTGRIVIYAGDGDDSVHGAGAVTVKTWMYGEDGNDTLNLGNGGGLAFGGAGNDQVNGGSGRDILIGGEGADRIVSNPGDDILISAVTRYDNHFSAGHEEAWRAIYAEWSTTLRTFRQRVDNLRGAAGTATRRNGAFYLNDDTVDDDTAVDVIGSQDVLTGASGEDWFIYKTGEDKVSSMTSLESTEDLTIR